MKKIIYVIVVLFSFAAFGANLNMIDFQQKNDLSYLNFNFDNSDFKIKKFQIVKDKQVVIDIENAVSTDRVLRAFDTSEFSGSVVFVSAFKQPGNKKQIRVIVQLRDNVRSKTQTSGNTASVIFENRYGAFASTSTEDNSVARLEDDKENESAKVLKPKSTSLEDILENLTLSGQKKYVGNKITLNVKDMKVNDILDLIADASGFNIIMTNEVAELHPLSLNLVNVPWDQALDTVLSINKLVAEKNGAILTIKTLAQATEERRKERDANQVKAVAEPLVTKVLPISYSKAKDLTALLKDYVTVNRGSIIADDRTNNLIINDTLEVTEKIAKIVSLLDRQTPQVLIESKIVEVNEGYQKQIGLQNGLNFGYDPVGQIPPTTELTGTPSTTAISGPGLSFSSAPAAGENARNLLGLSISRFGRLFNLDFQLQLLESESKGKIIATPRVVAKNNVKAEIISTDTTSFEERQGTGEDVVITFKETSVELSLAVTPQVSNDGAIDLTVELSKEQFGTAPAAGAPPDKAKREVKTNVLVENGSTIVLGGLYSYSKLETHSGVPYLKDMPIVGWLFRTPYNPQVSKTELVIFMTPRIINQDRAGLTSSL
ncbi:type IV pilus secretin PilQ [Halobacteriovorax sp. BALOs_7]|uniref:type IV pilus secretin PilQ n=1 Tax=Halobacteriovorax sp. BALOs_7 TaxID=2109558 RepID=UPI000EA28605|nr:type IV pilus secretin PilQ [Halobacteriovorax sp. BALOs_7]AYF43176.1 type IV pilus secretin PilQ [Halobacteriovorax sp. BALOs_7]